MPDMTPIDCFHFERSGSDRHLLPAVRFGDTLYLSGQIGLDPATGQLVDGIENQIHRVFANLRLWRRPAADRSPIGQAHRLSDRLVAFRPRQRDHARYFDKPYPARAVVGVAALPRAALIEADAILVASGLTPGIEG